jgi:hypothetical protein
LWEGFQKVQAVESWRKQLKFDPLPPLLSSENNALGHFARHDLLDEEVESVESLFLNLITQSPNH